MATKKSVNKYMEIKPLYDFLIQELRELYKVQFSRSGKPDLSNSLQELWQASPPLEGAKIVSRGLSLQIKKPCEKNDASDFTVRCSPDGIAGLWESQDSLINGFGFIVVCLLHGQTHSKIQIARGRIINEFTDYFYPYTINFQEKAWDKESLSKIISPYLSIYNTSINAYKELFGEQKTNPPRDNKPSKFRIVKPA